LPVPSPQFRFGRLLISICAALLAALTAFAFIRAGVFYSLYTWLFARVIELTGFDVWASRAITLLAVAILWSLPWHVLVLPWIGRAGRRVGTLFVVTALALATIEFVTRDVYFSRTDGRPLKYYIRTLDGYKFAAASGTDPVYGVLYQPITAEVAGHYMLWKARGGQMLDPSVPDSEYFNPGTGEPLRWYARLPNGRIDMFTLPGFHPTYGMKLLPATAEAVTEYDKQKTEAEKRRQDEVLRKRKSRNRSEKPKQRPLARREKQRKRIVRRDKRLGARRERKEQAWRGKWR
jgi:hypothetical protein